MSAAPLVRRTVAAVLAIALLTLAVVVIVEVVLRSLDRPSAVIDHQAVRADLAARPWDDPWVIVAWILSLLLGLALLGLALFRSRPRTVALATDAEGSSLSVRRRSLERYLAGVADAQPGVHGARASIRGQAVRVRGEAGNLDAQDVGSRVEQAVAARLRSLQPVPALTPTVNVRSREGR